MNELPKMEQKYVGNRKVTILEIQGFVLTETMYKLYYLPPAFEMLTYSNYLLG